MALCKPPRFFTPAAAAKVICAAPVVIDADQFTPPSQTILSLPIAQHVPPRPVGSTRIATTNFRRSGMSEDIMVLGGLAAVFCWTCIFLPLVYYHS
jgi:hypothetical protein